MVSFETGLRRLFNWSVLETVVIWVFDVWHLDEHAFVFGSGVKRNNCFPLSTIQDPVFHETSGEGETIMSTSVKLLQGDSSGSVSGSLLLPLINLPLPFTAVCRHVPGVFCELYVSGSLLLPLINLSFPFAALFKHVPGVFFELPVSGSLVLQLINLSFPFAAVFKQVPGVFFGIASVFTRPVSSACFSLEDHCLKESLVSVKKPLKDSISRVAFLDTFWHFKASEINSSIWETIPARSVRAKRRRSSAASTSAVVAWAAGSA